jgi:hypothetical protein
VRNLCSYGLILLAGLLLAGCGDQSPAETSSTIRFFSPAVRSDGVIAPRYECGGGSIWLPLRWGPVPPETKELVLYFGRYARAKGKSERALKVPFGILVTKLDPSRRGVNALPLEAEPTLIHRPFQSCKDRRGQNILLELFALKHPLPVPEAKTDTVLDLTEAVLGYESGGKDPKWVRELTEGALASGQIKATYGPQ